MNQSALFCENCGVRLTPDSRFCEQCGKPVNVQPEESILENEAPSPLPLQDMEAPKSKVKNWLSGTIAVLIILISGLGIYYFLTNPQINTIERQEAKINLPLTVQPSVEPEITESELASLRRAVIAANEHYVAAILQPNSNASSVEMRKAVAALGQAMYRYYLVRQHGSLEAAQQSMRAFLSQDLVVNGLGLSEDEITWGVKTVASTLTIVEEPSPVMPKVNQLSSTKLNNLTTQPLNAAETKSVANAWTKHEAASARHKRAYLAYTTLVTTGGTGNVQEALAEYKAAYAAKNEAYQKWMDAKNAATKETSKK